MQLISVGIADINYNKKNIHGTISHEPTTDNKRKIREEIDHGVFANSCGDYDILSSGLFGSLLTRADCTLRQGRTAA